MCIIEMAPLYSAMVVHIRIFPRVLLFIRKNSGFWEMEETENKKLSPSIAHKTKPPESTTPTEIQNMVV